MGADIIVGGGDRKHRTRLRTKAAKRFKESRLRNTFVKRLPAATRQVCLADAVAGLWLGGGTVYPHVKMDEMLSIGATSIRGAPGHLGRTKRRL